MAPETAAARLVPAVTSGCDACSFIRTMMTFEKCILPVALSFMFR
jgi:hypothetical protein